jgi:hypothetical protein
MGVEKIPQPMGDVAAHRVQTLPQILDAHLQA